MQLLLVSNSGRPFLEHCLESIDELLGPVRRVGYVTAARIGDAEAQYEKARGALARIGVNSDHFPDDAQLPSRIGQAEAVFCSGGNTYALLQRLRASGALEVLAQRVRNGMPYIGTSAGSNIAGPNVLATNDWNVVGAMRFDAMDLVPWVINPHYMETDPTMAPNSETRDMRIAEFLRLNAYPVLGIEEQAAVRVCDGRASAIGPNRLRLFVEGAAPRWIHPGEAVPAAQREGTHGG